MQSETIQSEVNEIRELRRALRDLVAISMLPAVSMGKTPREIAESGADALLRTLRLDLVYVQVKMPDAGTLLEVACTSSPAAGAIEAAELGRLLAPWLEGDPADARRSIPNPVGSGTTQVAVVPIGYDRQAGVVVAGSLQADFPNDRDRTVLSVAANHLATVLSHKWAEEALRRWELLFQHASWGIAIAEPDTHALLAINPAFAAMHGYTVDELVGRSIVETFAPESRAELPEHVRIVHGQGYHTYESVHIRKDGTRFPVLTNVIAHRDADGHVLYRAANLQDITAQKQAEERLREEARTIEAINRVGQMLAAELDEDQLVQAITDAGTELTGARFGLFVPNVLKEPGEAHLLYTLSGAAREAFDRLPVPRNTALFEPTFGGGDIVRLDDVTQHPRYGKDAPDYGMLRGQVPVRSYLAAPVISRSGEVLGGLFFGHPEAAIFTERVERIVAGIVAQAAVALDNARLYRRAQDAVRMRDEFLATVTHDLKNPLTTIRGRVQLLLRQASRDPERAREVSALEAIELQTAVMRRLIDQLLDSSQLQAGHELELQLDEADLVELVGRLAEQYRATTSQHEFVVHGADAAIVGRWDQDRLEQVIGNLLSNAVKYSPTGGTVTITVARTEDPTGAWAMLAVQDQGLGIPKVDLPKVFERFHRSSNVVGRIPGIGIGLAGSRSIVEQHGGTIAVESQEGVGSRFTVRLPLG
jgi:PAS domain S-box-containing protein